MECGGNRGKLNTCLRQSGQNSSRPYAALPRKLKRPPWSAVAARLDCVERSGRRVPGSSVICAMHSRAVRRALCWFLSRKQESSEAEGPRARPTMRAAGADN